MTHVIIVVTMVFFVWAWYVAPFMNAMAKHRAEKG